MKRLGRVLGSLIAVAVTVFSLQAFAAAQMGGRDFNHMTTGFMLSGGHAVAACETCHIGGVFKGTPRACDGCHVTGARVIATPKSNTHIVTDAPCESCHFNTATWLGARFNHGNAQVGQCTTCHNGRIAEGAPNSGTHLTPIGKNSCDSCHRTSVWSQHNWNHNGVGASNCDTAGCHVSGSNQYFMSTAHNNPKLPATKKAKSLYSCASCHNYRYWDPAPFNHSVGGMCTDCHVKPTGTTPFNHNLILATATCDNCHRTRSNGWSPAGSHTGNETNKCRDCHATRSNPPQPSSHTATEYTSVSCDACHKSQSTWSGASGHIDLVPPHVPTCRSCHSNDSHDGKDGANSSMDCSRSGCHKPGGNEGKQFSSW